MMNVTTVHDALLAIVDHLSDDALDPVGAPRALARRRGGHRNPGGEIDVCHGTRVAGQVCAVADLNQAR